jgi:hypothetical protein
MPNSPTQPEPKTSSKEVNIDEIVFYADYSLANPDTLTKYKQAGEISQKVLKTVSGKSHTTTPTPTWAFPEA